jgi:hypothetical protein
MLLRLFAGRNLRQHTVFQIPVTEKRIGIKNKSIYLPFCIRMKKEFGKWLMDIAKYMTTALLLSSTFGDMENPWGHNFCYCSFGRNFSSRALAC